MKSIKYPSSRLPSPKAVSPGSGCPQPVVQKGPFPTSAQAGGPSSQEGGPKEAVSPPRHRLNGLTDPRGPSTSKAPFQPTNLNSRPTRAWVGGSKAAAASGVRSRACSTGGAPPGPESACVLFSSPTVGWAQCPGFPPGRSPRKGQGHLAAPSLRGSEFIWSALGKLGGGEVGKEGEGTGTSAWTWTEEWRKRKGREDDKKWAILEQEIKERWCVLVLSFTVLLFFKKKER